jgi:hypothetical protein
MAQKNPNTNIKAFILSILFISLWSPTYLFSQKIKNSDVPDVVQETLLREHPMAKVREWSIEDKLYVATVTEDGMRGKIFIKTDGEWELSKFDTPARELPAKISDYVKNNYPNFNVTESSFAMNPTDRTFYYLEVRRTGIGAGLPSKLKFNTNGDLLNREDPEGFTIQETATEKEVERRERVAKNPETKEKKEKEVVKKEPDYIINETQVPAAIMKNYAKRFRGASNPVWKHKEGDTTYTVECVFRELKNRVMFHENGALIETRSEMPDKSIFGAVAKFLNENYKGYKYVYGEKIVRTDKNNGYETRIIERKYAKQKLETRIIFDKAGRILKSFPPEYEAESKQIDNRDKRFAKEFEKDIENSVDGAERMKNTEINIRELPSPIHTYIKANYPNYTTKNAYFIEDADLGNAYQVRVQMDGINQPFVELYFDSFGKFLRSEDDQGKEVVAQPEIPATELVYEVTVPEAVKTAFAGKFPKATNTTWDEVNDDFEATYDDKKGKQKALFAADGNWLSSSNEINTANVPTAIQDYIKKNHGKRTEITKAWLVKKNDKKTYYKVEIIDKKTNIDDVLEFTQTGKLVE